MPPNVLKRPMRWQDLAGKPKRLFPLSKAIQADDIDVRLAASLALAKIGPDAKAAVGALTSNLRDGDAKVRTYAAYALGKSATRARQPSRPWSRLPSTQIRWFARKCSPRYAR